MQLQLIPYSPHPAILFAFTLPVLPSTLPFPAAYAAQLHLLLNTDLDPPPSPYALDKAVWAVHLIELVIFDLPKLTVNVKMVDGSTFEWSMTGEQAFLLQVQHDVQQSTREAEREKREEMDAAVRAAASAAYLPITNSLGVDASPRREEVQERASNGRSSHRRSKSLFNSLLSALSLASSSSTNNSYRIGGGSLPPPMNPPPEAPSSYHDFDILAFSTSEYTFPVRPQLAIKTLPASRALRRRARSSLVDCFRRWVIPIIRERLQWGSFTPYDVLEPVRDGGGTKWGKMSKATNAYADWACRSMIKRCEAFLTEALPLLASSLQTADVDSEKADAESRRSSASSALISAISGSSHASTSPDQASLSDLDLDGFPEPLITATLRHSRLSASSDATSFTTTQDVPPAMRRIAQLRSSLDRFKDLHDMMGAEARAAADGHDFALCALEERVRRRAWSSTETAAGRRSRLSSRHDTVAFRVSDTSAPSVKVWTFSAANTPEFGTGRSIWELSVPTIRSALGEISSTWEDWQMEWEMERDFEEDEEGRRDIGFDLDGDSFPSVISDIEDISFPTESEGRHRSRSLGSGTETETGGKGGHSEFSDSSDDEDGVSTSTDDSSLSPTSPRSFGDSNSQRTTGARRGHGRRTGVKARIGTYEDVRDEMLPSPPLVALSPPPPRKTGQTPSKVGERSDPNSQGTENTRSSECATSSSSANALRPPRATRPTRLELAKISSRKESAHRREAASHGAGLARARLADLQSSSGLYDDWEVDTDAEFAEESNIFLTKSNDIQELFELSGATSPKALAGHSAHQRRYLAGIQKAMQENVQSDGPLSVLEHAGGSPTFGFNNAVGIVYPPGLHGDFPAVPPLPPSPTRRHGDRPQTDAQTGSSPPPKVTLERVKPKLSLAFPDPPPHIPSALTDSHISGGTAGGSGSGPLLALQEDRPKATSAPPTMSTFPESGFLDVDPKVKGAGPGQVVHDVGVITTVTQRIKKEQPALLLDTPTVEHPSSSYPYSWDVNVVPQGVVVVGTVGVVVDTTEEAKPEEDEKGKKKETETKSSTRKSPAKLRKPNPHAKPILCVTPPPPPEPPQVSSPSPMPYAHRLTRSKSWKGLLSRSDKDSLSVGSIRGMTKGRRKSAEPLASPSAAPEQKQERQVSAPSSFPSTPVPTPPPTPPSVSAPLPVVEDAPLLRANAPDVERKETRGKRESYYIPEEWFTKLPSVSEDSRIKEGPIPPPKRTRRTKSLSRLSYTPEASAISSVEEVPPLPAIPPLPPSCLAPRTVSSLIPSSSLPPPPRPAKSLKRSTSLNVVGMKESESGDS